MYAPFQVVEAEAKHGTLPGYMLIESSHPIVGKMIWALALMLLFVSVVSVIDLVRKGRARTTTLALTRIMSCLAPLLSLYAVGSVLMQDALRTDPPLGQDVTTFGSIGLMLGLGAFVGGIGVVLTALLTIEGAWRASSAAKRSAVADP